MKLIEEYYDNGRLKAIGNVSFNDEKNGLWVYYFENGDKQREVNFENGLEKGDFKSWYKNGNIHIERFEADENGDSLWKEYYEDGTIREIGMYKGNEYRPQKFWDENGKQLLLNGTGKKIEKYGPFELDIFEQHFIEGEFIREEKISTANYLPFKPTVDNDDRSMNNS